MKRYLVVGLIFISLFLVGGQVAESANNGPNPWCAGLSRLPVKPGTINWVSWIAGNDSQNPFSVSYLWSADGNTNQNYVKKYSLPQNAQVSFEKTNGIKMTANKEEFSCYPCTSKTSSFNCPSVVYRGCKVYAEGGYNGDGSFSGEVFRMVSEANSMKEYNQIGFYGVAGNNSADAVGESLVDLISKDLAEYPDLQVLVAAHSLGAVGTYNIKDFLESNGVDYLLYDPPYNEYWSNTCPTWAPNCFEFIGNAQAIERAKNGGIATSGHLVDWTKGTTKPLACHIKYKTNPTALNAVKSWLSSSCAEGNRPNQTTPQPGIASNYSFTVMAVGGGAVRASGPTPECAGDPISAPVGGSKTFNIAPNSGSYLSNLYIDGNFYPNPPKEGFPYTFSNVKTNHYVYAVFNKKAASYGSNNTSTTTATTTLSNYKVLATVMSGSGSISPSGSVIIPRGTSKTFTFNPATGYKVNSVIVDNQSVGTPSSYTFSNVQANHTLKVTFSSIPVATTPAAAVSAPVTTTASSSTLSNYKILTTVYGSGSVSPSGSVIVAKGNSKTFTFSPNSGYRIAYVSVDNQSVGTPSSYTFSSVQSNHTLKVTFGVIPTATTTRTTTTTTPSSSASTSAMSNAYFQVANILVSISQFLKSLK